MTRKLLALSCLFIFLQSCAEGTTDNIPDADSQTKPDVSQPPPTDTGSDVKGTIIKPVCEPAEQLCEGAAAVKICRADGTGFDITPCQTPQICAAGVCKPPPICTPGEKKCADPGTVSTCRATGEAWSATSCMPGEGCIKGICATGKINGADCVDNTECASNTCHCGSDETCGLGQAGFCVSKGCEQGCEDGFCFDGLVEFAGRITGYDFCLERCEGACDSLSQACHEVPAKTGFERGCYFNSLNPIGGDCSEQADCAGEICRRDYFRESNLCTRNCDANTPCPEGTGCVDLDGAFQCTLLCGDGSAIGAEPCPLDLPTDRFDVTCKTTATADGGALRVCVTP